MFFCSCGSQVVPATPAQLLTVLSRGAATVAAAAAAGAAGEAASQHSGTPQHVSTCWFPPVQLLLWLSTVAIATLPSFRRSERGRRRGLLVFLFAALPWAF